MNERQHIEEHAIQRELNAQIREFLNNHWPHLNSCVATMNGKLTILLWAMGGLLSLIVAVTVKFLTS